MNKTQNIKQQLEEVIKKNLPEKKESRFTIAGNDYGSEYAFNEAIDKIPVSLIADEVLKVVVEKIKKVVVLLENAEVMSGSKLGIETKNKNIAKSIKLLSNLSPNKENKNNE